MTRQIKVYLAGPMTGLPDFNRPVFFQAGNTLHDHNHIILNPAVLPDGLEHGDYMKICLPMIEAAEAVIMLPGWEKSKGANMEYNYAQIKRLPVFEAEIGHLANREDASSCEYLFGPEGIDGSVTITPTKKDYWLPALRLTVLAASSNVDAPNLSDFITCAS